MSGLKWLGLGTVLLAVLAPASLAAADQSSNSGDWSGYAAIESRSFLEDAASPEQSKGTGGSVVLEPEYYREWNDGRDSFLFTPFVRLDSEDNERSHADVRELYWRRAERGWELLVGVSRVFWGVAESQHLVDIVNQTDLVENPDGEDKLGQPMLKYSLVRSWGIFDFFVLPGFRERTFPGEEGRLRPAPPIATDRARYESGAEEEHVDWALRWSRAVGPFDIGLSHFSGTSREPRLLPETGPDGTDEFIPFYDLIDQTGLDAQATLGSWLWKLEAIHRTGQGDPFSASVGGFEYTFWDVSGSGIDVGLLSEYHWDERGEAATTPFEDDIFVGSRLALNDVQSTEVLAGAILDRNSDATLFLVEASRRLGSKWKVELELRTFSGQPPSDPLAALRTDDYFQLSIQRHF